MRGVNEVKVNKGELITLEDNQKFVVVDIATFDNEKFVLLVNNENESDILIQKINYHDLEMYLEPLKDKEEFDTLLEVFYNRNKKLLKN